MAYPDNNRQLHPGTILREMFGMALELMIDPQSFVRAHILHPTIYTPQFAPYANIPLGPSYLSGGFAPKETFSEE
jgi:hypothetical protein